MALQSLERRGYEHKIDVKKQIWPACKHTSGWFHLASAFVHTMRALCTGAAIWQEYQPYVDLRPCAPVNSHLRATISDMFAVGSHSFICASFAARWPSA